MTKFDDRPASPWAQRILAATLAAALVSAIATVYLTVIFLARGSSPHVWEWIYGVVGRITG